MAFEQANCLLQVEQSLETPSHEADISPSKKSKDRFQNHLPTLAKSHSSFAVQHHLLTLLAPLSSLFD